MISGQIILVKMTSSSMKMNINLKEIQIKNKKPPLGGFLFFECKLEIKHYKRQY